MVNHVTSNSQCGARRSVGQVGHFGSHSQKPGEQWRCLGRDEGLKIVFVHHSSCPYQTSELTTCRCVFVLPSCDNTPVFDLASISTFHFQLKWKIQVLPSNTCDPSNPDSNKALTNTPNPNPTNPPHTQQNVHPINPHQYVALFHPIHPLDPLPTPSPPSPPHPLTLHHQPLNNLPPHPHPHVPRTHPPLPHPPHPPPSPLRPLPHLPHLRTLPRRHPPGRPLPRVRTRPPPPLLPPRRRKVLDPLLPPNPGFRARLLSHRGVSHAVEFPGVWLRL